MPGWRNNVCGIEIVVEGRVVGMWPLQSSVSPSVGSIIWFPLAFIDYLCPRVSDSIEYSILIMM